MTGYQRDDLRILPHSGQGDRIWARTPELQGALVATEQRLRMSYEEYLTWTDDMVHAEWVNGEMIVFMPPKPRHQEIVSLLCNLLGLFVQTFHLGKVLIAPPVSLMSSWWRVSTWSVLPRRA